MINYFNSIIDYFHLLIEKIFKILIFILNCIYEDFAEYLDQLFEINENFL